MLFKSLLFQGFNWKKMHRLLEHSATRRRIFIAHGILVSFLLMLSWKSTYLLKDNVKIWGRMKENIFMWVKCWNDVVCNKYVGPICKSLLTSSQCFSMGECGLCLGDMLASIGSSWLKSVFAILWQKHWLSLLLINHLKPNFLFSFSGLEYLRIQIVWTFWRCPSCVSRWSLQKKINYRFSVCFSSNSVLTSARSKT